MRPVIINYDYLANGDIAFKLLDNGDYSDPEVRLLHLPYLFMRSEIRSEIRRTPTHTLFLRNNVRAQDYMINFQNAKNLSTFLTLFPGSTYNDYLTVGYYFMMSYP